MNDRQITEAYQRGFEAYEDGLKVRHNPYPASDKRHRQWETGWHNARTAAVDPS